MYNILYIIHIGGRVGVVRCQGWGGQGAEGGHRLIPTPLLLEKDLNECHLLPLFIKAICCMWVHIGMILKVLCDILSEMSTFCICVEPSGVYIYV